MNDHEEEPSEDEDIFKPQFILVYTGEMILLHKDYMHWTFLL